jgi:uncharacterized protein YfaS (alpha-2-macroglobulin family)
MWVLGEAMDDVLEVDFSAEARGLGALETWVNDRKPTPDGDGGTLAQAAYVLATLGHVDHALNARLYEARAGLPRYGQAFLLMAMWLGHESPATVAQLSRELRSMIVHTGDSARLPEVAHPGDDALAHYYSTDTRTSAIALIALLMVAPDDAAVGELTEGLRQSVGPGDRYESTQDNIYSLVALARVAERVRAGRASVTIKLDGKALGPPRLLRGTQVARLSVPLAGLAPGTISIESTGSVRYAVALVAARRSDPTRPQDSGLAVTRLYRDPKTMRPVTKVSAGQVVEVVLQVQTPVRRDYVALEDPLPAGVEVVNPHLVTSGARADATDPWWQVWTWTELRDDRALAFADDMPGGSHTLRYLVRATLPGTFTAAPPHAELMYHPGIGGRGTSTTLTVTP